MHKSICVLTLSLTLTACSPPPSSTSPALLRPVQVRPLEEYLQKGLLKEGVEGLVYQLQQKPGDSSLQMSLGVVQFLRAIEKLAQGMHRYGLQSRNALGIPFLRLPVPENKNATEVTYPDLRKLFEELIQDLQAAEATFAKVEDGQVKLPIELSQVQFDLDGDSKPDIRLLDIAAQYLGGPERLPKDTRLLTAFDRSDASWFRGYCHLLMAQSEVVLTYDCQEIFDHTAHIFFARPKTPYAFLKSGNGKDFYQVGDGLDLMDVIAWIHLLRMPVKDKAGGQRALDHFMQVIALSRQTWKEVRAETDNDREWLPSPSQDGILGVKVSEEIVTGWHEFLDESEALLQGKKLIPFWRSGESRGVNLRKAFSEPGPFDLVLWLQGPGAAPYLEDGPKTSKDNWNRLTGVFRGQFMNFALWFN